MVTVKSEVVKVSFTAFLVFSIISGNFVHQNQNAMYMVF